MSAKERDNQTMGVVKGSGNVFADLGVPNADEELAKAELAFAIRQRIQNKALNQMEAAALLGTDQPKVSLLMNGKVGGFTIDRLARFLNALQVDVHITLQPAPDQKKGETLVKAANTR